MYGFAAPRVIAIDSDLVSDCGRMQQLAGRLIAALESAPIRVVIGAPEIEAPLAEFLEDLHRLPPDTVFTTDANVGVAQALQTHLEDLGAKLPLRAAHNIEHSLGSAITPGHLNAAVEVAKLHGTDVEVWTSNPDYVPEDVDGVRCFGGELVDF